MAPLHHHFELSGWSQTQVSQRFTIIAAVAAMVGIALALTFAGELVPPMQASPDIPGAESEQLLPAAVPVSAEFIGE